MTELEMAKFDPQQWSKDKLREYDNKFGPLNHLIDMLEGDFNEVLQEFYVNREDQLKRRTLVRTLFATIEGTIFSLKQTALEFFRLQGVEIPPSEYSSNEESEIFALTLPRGEASAVLQC